MMTFSDREAFRAWLAENGATSEGVWLLFGKAGGPRTLTAGEALEEALCFGWIDGQMQRIDDTSYKKYFAQRRVGSKWSAKNKALVEGLEKQGRMTEAGRAKIAEARENGQWDAPQPAVMGEAEIALVSGVLKGHEPAYTNFLAMPPSVQRTYARGYLDAKTDKGRASRLAWMVDRLDRNLKPM